MTGREHDGQPCLGPIRLGKIGYLNVLPIYHPIEENLLDHDFRIVSGPPAELNRIMASGGLDLSAASSVEYARHSDDYYLIPDLAIGSKGPVQSVLLLSREPILKLDGRTILVSAQTHTSATLLRLLLEDHMGVKAAYEVGNATERLENGDRPAGILAIGDEALELRRHPDYPHSMDLGEAWRQWTGLPFIFGVWIVRRDRYHDHPERMQKACMTLLAAKKWGQKNLGSMCTLAARSSRLDAPEMCSYFNGLVYDLGDQEQHGLRTFFDKLVRAGLIDRTPELHFLP